MIVESFNQQPLATIAPSYLYFQYADDDDLQAFVGSYNTITQGYLDWFNANPLGIYTAPAISGSLLDWIGMGVYGINRPFLSTTQSKTIGATDTAATNKYATNKHRKFQTGTTQIVSDDLYKRVLTWNLYKGDGYQVTMEWLKKRVARFIYGANGGDISLNEVYNIGLSIPSFPPAGSTNSTATNSIATNSFVDQIGTAQHLIDISIPSSSIAENFSQLISEKYLPLPFQVSFSVTLV